MDIPNNPNPTPVLMPLLKQPSNLPFVLTSTLILIILIGIAWAGYFYRGTLANVLEVHKVPSELRSLSFLTSYPQSSLFQLGSFGFTRVATELGSIVEYSKQNGVAIALIHPTQDTHTIIEVAVLNGTPKFLTKDGLMKRDLALSTDGSMVAYTGLTMVGSGTTTQAQWHVKVLDIAKGTETDLGNGSAPYFVDPEDSSIILYTNSDGLIVKNIKTGQTSTTAEFASQNVARPVSVSSDGAYALLFDKNTNRYAVFTLYRTFPEIGLTPLGELDHQFASVYTTSTHLYGITIENGLTQVWEYTLGDTLSKGKPVYTFPEGMVVSKII